MPRANANPLAAAIVVERGTDCVGYTARDLDSIQRAVGAYSAGMPDKAVARAAMVSDDMLADWLSRDDEHGVALKMARARGMTGLHTTVYREATKGAGHVCCDACKEPISHCPHCQEELPERGDPKWAAWLLEKFPEYRQKIELGPLQGDFEAASKLTEQELVVQIMRAISYPEGPWQRALDAAFERPGPELARRLESWALKHSFSIDTTGEPTE